MTTFVQFNSSQYANFQFNPTLDGVTYTAICTFNVYSSRYYISIYNSNGTLIVINPIVASPDDFDINLVFGYFQTSTLLYRASSNNFEINP
jgi:hypothetical protein